MDRSPGQPDGLRQLAVLLTALAQPILTISLFSGRGYQEVFGASTPDALIVPASWAFMIWTAIFVGCLGYAVYQALPGQRSEPLLRAIGWPMASAFLATNLWLITAHAQRIWLTVICIVWIAGSLLPAFRRLHRVELTGAQRQWVLVPISVFLGWVSVASFANLLSAAKRSGFADLVLSEAGWSILLLATAVLLADRLLRESGGNLWYGGGVVWALVAIAAANLPGATGRTHGGVAVAAAVAALLVLASMVRARLRPAR